MGRSFKMRSFALCFILLWAVAGCAMRSAPSLPPDLAEVFSLYSPPYLSQALSPNGRWLAELAYEPPRSAHIAISEVTSREVLLQTPLPKGDVHAYLEGWSPDSSAVVFASMRKGCQRCPFSHILIVDVIPPDYPAQTHLYTFPEEQSNLVFRWSPQGKRLAVWIDWTSVLILDREARPVTEFRLAQCGLEEHLVGDAQIADDGTLYLVVIPSFSEQKEEPSRWAEEVLVVQGEELNQCRSLYRSPDSLALVAIDSEGRFALLNEGDFGAFSPTSLHLIDVGSGEVIETFDIPGPIAAVSSHGRWTALCVDRPFPEEERLLVFDWQQHKIEDYGTVWGIVGWRDNVGGFLIAKESEEDEGIHFEVIRP